MNDNTDNNRGQDKKASTISLTIVPENLNCTTVTSKINDIEVDCFLDTALQETLMGENTAKSIIVKTQGKPFAVFMATNKFTTNVLIQVITDIKVQGRTYFNISFGGVPFLYADVILGQHFLKQYKEVVFQLDGHQEKMIVGSNDRCGITVFTFETPRIFHNMLSTCRPIATKLRNLITKTNFSSKKR